MSEVNGKYAPRPGHIPGAQVNLGGHEFVLAPLGLRLMREIEAKTKDLAARTDPPATAEDWYELNVGTIVLSLQRNYPEITRESIDDLIDSQNVTEALKAVLEPTGLRRLKPGELQPGSRLTGTPSMPSSAPLPAGRGNTSMNS